MYVSLDDVYFFTPLQLPCNKEKVLKNFENFLLSFLVTSSHSNYLLSWCIVFEIICGEEAHVQSMLIFRQSTTTLNHLQYNVAQQKKNPYSTMLSCTILSCKLEQMSAKGESVYYLYITWTGEEEGEREREELSAGSFKIYFMFPSRGQRKD